MIGKHLCRSLFLIKLQASVCNLKKKEALAQVASWEFCEIFKSTYFTEHLRATPILSEFEGFSPKKNSFFKKNKAVCFRKRKLCWMEGSKIFCANKLSQICRKLFNSWKFLSLKSNERELSRLHICIKKITRLR